MMSKDTRDLLRLPAGLHLESLNENTLLISGDHEAPFREATWEGIGILGLKQYLAFCLTSHFVTSPFFGTELPKIPGGCQFLLWEEGDGSFGVLLPLLDADFRSEMRGAEEGLEVRSDCGPVGRPSRTVAVALLSHGPDPFLLVNQAAKQAIDWMGRGSARETKRTPRWMEYLGWCTWDAFYTDVDEVKILKGLEAFQAGGLIPGHIIIDEGWQDCTPSKYLKSFGLKCGAFTGDSLQSLILRAKSEFGVKMVGCWRTLFGQLRGVDIDAPGLSPLRRRLVHEPGTDNDTFGVVEPSDVNQFHQTYAARLAADGVDFLKVDFQSALHLMTHELLGRAEAARLWQHSLQDSVNQYFEGEILNCMAMGSDEIFHTRTSNVGRSSDDFFPNREDSHPAHIRQNLYNALWFSPFQWPDWDMFQSSHPWAWYHAVGRAISGGPVYVSDKPGESDFGLLQRFVAADGKILRCQQPALPTRDALFVDPSENHRFIKAFNRCGDIGLVAVFHPDPSPASLAIEEKISADQIEGLGAGLCAVFSLNDGFLGVCASLVKRLPFRDADLLVFSPLVEGFAPIGLLEKMNPPGAIISWKLHFNGLHIEARGGGRFGVYSDRPIREVLMDGVPAAFQQENGLVTFDTEDRVICRITIQ